MTRDENLSSHCLVLLWSLDLSSYFRFAVSTITKTSFADAVLPVGTDPLSGMPSSFFRCSIPVWYASAAMFRFLSTSAVKPRLMLLGASYSWPEAGVYQDECASRTISADMFVRVFASILRESYCSVAKRASWSRFSLQLHLVTGGGCAWSWEG
jgi:hypothetical protein